MIVFDVDSGELVATVDCTLRGCERERDFRVSESRLLELLEDPDVREQFSEEDLEDLEKMAGKLSMLSMAGAIPGDTSFRVPLDAGLLCEQHTAWARKLWSRLQGDDEEEPEEEAEVEPIEPHRAES